MKQIPLLFKNANYETDVPVKIKDKIEKIVSTRKGLYIYGPAGVGKTHTAYAIVKFFEDKRFSVDVYNTSDMFRMMRNNFKNNSDDDSQDVYEDIINSRGLLIMDDIGAEKVTDWVRESFYLIINNKYENMIPIIFTSNYSLDELAEKVGDRICSRIAGICDVIKLEGEDKRIKNHE